MSNTTQRIGLIALLVTASACSTTPGRGPIDTGGLGETVGNAAGKTAEVVADAGSSAWSGMVRFFGLSEEQRQAGKERSDEELLDEVDLAMLEDDAPAASVVITPVDGGQAAELVDDTVANSEDISLDSTLESDSDIENVIAEIDTTLPNVDNTVAMASIYTHEVQMNESLWEIAKATTGDATNWHTIADVNDLAPNASVFPGQSLEIPNEIVKPELLASANGVMGDAASGDTMTDAVAADASDLLAAADDDAAVLTDDAATTITAANDAAVLTSETAGTVAATETAALTDAATILTDEAAATTAAAGDTATDALQSTDGKLALPGADSELASNTADATTATPVEPSGQAFEVAPNETLWDFAKRTTGDATNWQAIAEHNQFTSKQASLVRAGQSIVVPYSMVSSDGVASAIGDASPDLVEDVTETIDAAATPVEDAATDVASVADETSTDAYASVELSDGGNVLDGENILISGTYYPKAIYNDADFSSSLLMRVSPGTSLQVSRAIGPWYEVRTDKGVGYVHSRDIK